jgi:2-polyprenyl-6-methoxyphenol hydroxylase-like FAD-dependent oxidoreductase
VGPDTRDSSSSCRWQCGYVIPKEANEQIRKRGLQSFRNDLAAIAPFGPDRFGELQDWDVVKLLTVQVDRLIHWYRPGLLLIGDAAHAMSPIGGVGINLAIQDAVAAANLLANHLRSGRLTDEHLRCVQRRRECPTRTTQRIQLLIQNRVLKRVLEKADVLRPPDLLRLIARFPFLTRITGRLIGMGFRPEHIRTPNIYPQFGRHPALLLALL